MKRRVSLGFLLVGLLFGLMACGSNSEVVEDGPDIKTDSAEEVDVGITESPVTIEVPEEESEEVVDSGMFGGSALSNSDNTKSIFIGDNITLNVLAEFVGWHLDEKQPYADIIYMVENYSEEPHAFSGILSFEAVDSERGDLIQTTQIAPMDIGYFVNRHEFSKDEAALVEKDKTLSLVVDEQSDSGENGYWAGEYMEAIWVAETEDSFTIIVKSILDVEIHNATAYILYLSDETGSCVGVTEIELSDDGNLSPNAEVNKVIQKSDIPDGTVSIAVLTYGSTINEVTTESSVFINEEN